MKNNGSSKKSWEWEYKWDSSKSQAGELSIKAVAYDKAGNRTEDSIVVNVNIIDTTPPVIAITSPTNNSIVIAPVTLMGTAADTISGIQKIQVSTNTNAGWIDAAGTTLWSYTFNNLSGVTNILYAKAIDNAGNESTNAWIKVTIDTNIPTINITYPADSLITNSTSIAIGGTASDNINVTLVQVSTNNGATWDNATGTTNWTYNIILPNGTYPIQAKAQDNNNNWSSIAQITVTVDTISPTVAITSPTNNTVSALPITFNGTAADSLSGIQKVQVSTNPGAGWSDATGTNSWSYIFHNLPAGTNTLYARSIDNAGNQSLTNSINVIYDTNIDPTRWPFEIGLDGWQTNGGAISAEISSNHAKYGANSLKVNIQIDAGNPRQGISYEFANPTNLSGMVISVWAYLPTGVYPAVGQNVFNIVLQDATYSWDNTWANIPAGTSNTWIQFTADVSALMVAGDDTQVKKIIIEVISNAGTYTGPVYIDSIDILDPGADPSTFGFEVSHDAWGDGTLTGGFKSRAQTIEKAYLGAGSLKIHCELTNNGGVNSSGDIKVEPGSLNFTGSTNLVFWLWIPSEFYGSDWVANPHDLNLYIQSGPWVWTDTWINLNNIADADKWTKYTYDLSGATDIADINGIGFKLFINAANPTTFNGDIYLDSVNPEP